MEAIELLQPGIYGMEITDRAGAGGKPAYDVTFREYRLEDIIAKLNPLQRQDERPFEAVQTISEFNQRAYELFLRPFVKATANEGTARLLRDLHPLRARNWALSDTANPWLAWLGPAAQAVKAQRASAPTEGPLRKIEELNAELTSAGLDYYRAVRDALAEATFFTTYGNIHLGYLAEQPVVQQVADQPFADSRERPVVRDALARIAEGGTRKLLHESGSCSPAPMSRSRCRSSPPRRSSSRITPSSCRRCRRINGVAYVESRKSSLAMSPSVRSKRCPDCSTLTSASACLR